MKAQDMLPDGQDFVVRDGIALRKGSVAAFMANAMVLTQPNTSAESREAAERDLLELLPTLDALRLFEVFELRSAELRALVARHRAAAVTRASAPPA